MNNFNMDETRKFYEDANSVWSNSPWYKYSYSYISAYLKKLLIPLHKNNYILNAGSAGNTYDIDCRMHHIDIAENKICHCDEYTVASIEKIPFADNTFDGAICVGSVINYTDAILSISELIRVVKSSGLIIIEFENSNGFEYLFSKNFKKDTAVIKTPYLGKEHRQWIYSYQYIFSIINSFDIEIINVSGFHIFDGLFAKNDNIAIKFSKLDKLANYIPALKKYSGNIIVALKKL